MSKLLFFVTVSAIFSIKSVQAFDVNLNEILSNKSTDNFDYKFIHNPYCNNEESLQSSMKLTFVVKTREDNLKRRMAIRETWGFENQLWPDVSLRTIFNVGISDDMFITEQVRIESEVFQDILQSDFCDTYRNNTLKTVMGIKWAATNCKETDFFLFVDDDMLVSVKNLVAAFKDGNYSRESLLYMGHLMGGTPPIREVGSQYYVSEEAYPFKLYPDYASGGAMIFSQKSLKILNTGIPKIFFFNVDDALIGVAASAFKIPATVHPEIKMFHNIDMKNWAMHTKTIATHGFKDIDDMVNMWNLFNKHGFA